MDFKRKLRLEELIKTNLSLIIQRDISGMLPGIATIMRAELSDDAKYAKIFVSFYGPEHAKRKSLHILKKEVKNIRRKLGKGINLRYNPMLSIVADTSLDNAFRINDLLSQINTEPDDSEHKEE